MKQTTFLLAVIMWSLIGCSNEENYIEKKSDGAIINAKSFPVGLKDTTINDYKRYTWNLHGENCRISIYEKENSKTACESAKCLIPVAMNELNLKLDHRNKESEIYRLNHAVLDTWIELSPDVSRAFTLAEKLHKMTNRAFDITIGPIFGLYRFDQKEYPALPSRQLIREALSLVGPHAYSFEAQASRAKRNLSGASAVLSALIDGLIVDKALDVARQLGLTGVSITFSGESGFIPHKDKNRWFCYLLHMGSLGKIMVKWGAASISGNRNNFFTIHGKRYSHIIDPQTGMPTESGVGVAAVFARECWMADGLATALGVMGVEKGLKLINSLKDVDAILWYDGPDGRVTEYKSNGIEKLQNGTFVWNPEE